VQLRDLKVCRFAHLYELAAAPGALSGNSVTSATIVSGIKKPRQSDFPGRRKRPERDKDDFDIGAVRQIVDSRDARSWSDVIRAVLTPILSGNELVLQGQGCQVALLKWLCCCIRPSITSKVGRLTPRRLNLLRRQVLGLLVSHREVGASAGKPLIISQIISARVLMIVCYQFVQ